MPGSEATMKSEPLFRVSETASGDRIRQLDTFVRSGDLVPVERCEHGYLDEHQWYDTFCPGAGIGDNDE